jgi:hypothetical protein
VPSSISTMKAKTVAATAMSAIIRKDILMTLENSFFFRIMIY